MIRESDYYDTINLTDSGLVVCVHRSYQEYTVLIQRKHPSKHYGFSRCWTSDILESMKKGEFSTSLDFKDAYFVVVSAFV